MASSRKRPSAEVIAAVEKLQLQGKRVAVGLSGGVDSVVLLHALSKKSPVRAVHVHHGLSPNADAWAAFCRKLCRRLAVPLTVRRVKVAKRGEGLEAAARQARYDVFKKIPAEVIVLGHHLDDQAETVLMNLLRGAGARGASGMAREARFDGKELLRPLLDTPRAAILAYAREHGLEWIEDESNADESLTRNFVRRRLGPLIESRFPAWKESLARAARLFSQQDARAQELLRSYLGSKGLRAPSEAKLVEMLRQLTSGGARTRIEHDGATLRLYRDKVIVGKKTAEPPPFSPVKWKGERRLPLPALGGELRFRPGPGIDAKRLKRDSFEVRLRSGGERLQPHPRRPRRTLKNLFQEAGVPSWARERMPLLYCGKDLVWAPGLGVDVRYQGPGLLPEWHPASGKAELYDEVTGGRAPSTDSEPASRDHSRVIKTRLRVRHGDR
jgi:tRNA(Ile)-lysidine synthase